MLKPMHCAVRGPHTPVVLRRGRSCGEVGERTASSQEAVWGGACRRAGGRHFPCHASHSLPLHCQRLCLLSLNEVNRVEGGLVGGGGILIGLGVLVKFKFVA